MELQHKLAFVTGGAQGIGQGICKQLAQAGAHVLIADINYDKAIIKAKEMENNGYSVHAIKLDVGNREEIEKTVSSVTKEHGPIEILVNNAGTITMGSVLELAEDDWDLVMNVNAKGVFFLSQAIARVMIKEKLKGRIINISSIGAKIPFENQVHYCASKSAVLSISRVFALELSKYGITVNSICPGAVDGDVLKKCYNWVALKTGQKPEEILNQWLSPVLINRLITPEEIGALVVFLCSKEAAVITGQAINIDGGRIFD